MIYILFSVICSVTVSVLLKLAKRYEIDVKQAIAWNYLAAVVLTCIFFRPSFSAFSINEFPWEIHGTLAVLLPSLFVIIAASVKYTGIVRTDIAQRLSLFLPVLASFLLFNETLNGLKILGLITGFTAIICSIPWQKKEDSKTGRLVWIYPLIVFAGMGIIDILFKQVAQYRTVPYTSSLLIIYILAFLLSAVGLIFLFLTGRSVLSWKNFLSGWILGIANFGNILFYLKAHQSQASRPTLVFSSMNIGVVVLAALTGLWLFNEKLSLLNKIGIVLAIISILMISFA